MSGRIIEIIVDPQGQTRIETRGFTGSACLDASRFIESALGHKYSERMTAEFFQLNAQQQHLREGGG